MHTLCSITSHAILSGKIFLFSFHLTMMTWSHRNVVLNFFRLFFVVEYFGLIDSNVTDAC